MDDQHRNEQSPHKGQSAPENPKREFPGAGPRQKQQTDQLGKAHQSDQKPKTEQASHQGGDGVRSDHKPQGTGTPK